MKTRTLGVLSIGALIFQACAVQQLSVGEHDSGVSAPLNEIGGRICLAASDPSDFPVKVVLLVENSLSQCAVDPGTLPDGGTGACPRLPVRGANVAARTRLIESLLERAGPSTTFHLAPFEGRVVGGAPFSGFAAPGDPTFKRSAADLVAQATGPADYEGALVHAYTVIARDIQQMTDFANFSGLARTRYVVLLVGSGLPGLRCGVGVDAPGDLNGGWSSTDTTQCRDVDFTALVRNQPSRLVELAVSFGPLGQDFSSSVRLHTIQLFDEPALAACGAACASAQPWRPGPGGRSWTTREQLETGRLVMAELARAGGGTLTQASTAAELAAVTVPPALTESALSLNILKSLVLVPRSSTRGIDGPVVDSDGDGIPNAEEPGGKPNCATCDAFLDDRDGDCFSDGLEQRLARSHGFDPSIPDPRGCDSASPLTRNCSCRDADGDGLSDFAERYFGTSGFFAVDSDADGLPDGVEVAALMRPDQRLPPARDTDGDGVTDHDEVLALTDPQRDGPRRHAVSTEVTVVVGGESLANGHTCYDFAIRNVPLVDAPAPFGAPEKTGWNRFIVYADEVAQSVGDLDVGRWRAACAWLRMPATGERASLLLKDTDFVAPRDALTRCKEVAP